MEFVTVVRTKIWVTSATKGGKQVKIRGSMEESLKGGGVMENRGRETIEEVNYNGECLSTKLQSLTHGLRE